jgi:hypothetical protein
MDITFFEFRPGGLAIRFDDGEEVVALFKVRNGVMFMDGLTSVQQQALSAFLAKADFTALLDPRLDRCTPAGDTGQTDMTGDGDVDVANHLLQWSRVDSIVGLSDGDTAVFWPALAGEDGFATVVDPMANYTGGGKIRHSFLNGHPVLETSDNPSVEGISSWDDWNGLEVGTRPVCFIWVSRIGGGGVFFPSAALNSSGTLFNDSGIGTNTKGMHIFYQGGAFGWKANHWGVGVTNPQPVTSRVYAAGDTNWHVYSMQFLTAPDRQMNFYDGFSLQSSIGDVTQEGSYPTNTKQGFSVFNADPTFATSGAGDATFRGWLAEFRIYEGIMTDADRNAVVQELKDRYAI